MTVPASFDEAARELTVQAAQEAGLERVTLLEEPQAAFYCWIVTHQDVWQREVRGGELILVCDVGGGTTDFSLITVVETPTGPGFRRVAVGDHLMLGGDNIDLALAHRVEAKLGGVKLDANQWNGLRFACRVAKEKLLGDDSNATRWPVTIAGRGSKLIGGGIQSEVTREEVLDVVLNGFLPMSGRDEEPSREKKLGLQEFGLPFVSDPAIPRHLSAFLRRHRAEAVLPEGHDPAAIARPDAILFNGGALTPRSVRDRIVRVVEDWFAPESNGAFHPRVLSNESLDLAVAYGAAYYGVVRRGGGIRIGGGTARSFYVGFEAESRDQPWLCVVPRDAQEGDEIAVEGHDLELVMGRPVLFPLASSSVRPSDRPGDLVSANPESILDLPPLVGLMRAGRKAKAETVPVRLTTRVTEIGTIELWCQSRVDDRRWRLQIQFRGGSEKTSRAPRALMPEAGEGVVIEQSEIDAGCEAIRTAFHSSRPQDEHGVDRLVKRLEAALDAPRDQWPSSALRGLWEPLRELAELRFTTPRHEARWLNFAGFCLRPGLGFPLDEHRIKALWPVFHAGVKHVKETQCWVEWWVLWRRVAAGLTRAHHDEIYRRLQPYLFSSRGQTSAKKPTRPKPEPHEISEMWRCVTALERLSADAKESLGQTLVSHLNAPTREKHLLWCLGRLGARVLLYGPANAVVTPEAAATWAEAVLRLEGLSEREQTDAIFALGCLGRVSGDRSLDLDASLRERISNRLEQLGASEDVRIGVREYHALEAEAEGRALGDALPAGLRLLAPTSTDGA